MSNLARLSEFCVLANKLILDFYGSRGSCIFSVATVCDVLAHFGFRASPLRVEAAIFHPEPRTCGCILGSDGNGERLPRAGRDMWYGHLVSLVEDQYLVDTTLDQVRDTHSYLVTTPCVVYLPDTSWDREPDYHCTGNLSLFPTGVTVRYTKFRRQNGWQSAGDFRPGRRKQIVRRLIERAQGHFL